MEKQRFVNLTIRSKSFKVPADAAPIRDKDRQIIGILTRDGSFDLTSEGREFLRPSEESTKALATIDK